MSAGSFAESNLMQQYWRDANTAARHAGLQPVVGYEVYGKSLLGSRSESAPWSERREEAVIQYGEDDPTRPNSAPASLRQLRNDFCGKAFHLLTILGDIGADRIQ
jgi:hypothetical protein